MIASCTRAELMKLRRRPAVWVLGLVAVLATLLFGYLLLYALVATQAVEQAGAGVEADDLIPTLLPERMAVTAVTSASSFGAGVAVVLGALVVGSEYAWGTVRTVATQGPSRGAIAVGRLAALAVVTFILAAAILGVSAGASALVAVLESAAVSFPAPLVLLAALGACWLVLAVWAVLGAGLATLFRSSGLAIGIGLAWALLVESIVGVLPLPESIGEVVGRVLLGSNATALATGFGELSAFGGVTPPPATPVQAAVALGAWLLVFAVVAVVPFTRREIR